MRALLAAIILVVAAAVPPAIAAGPTEATFTLFSQQQDRWVEQQSTAVFDHQSPEHWMDFCPEECVSTVSYQCAWDVDDVYQFWAVGTITDSISQTSCVIADGAFNWGHEDKAGIVVWSKSPDLQATITDSEGGSWEAPKVYVPEQRKWRWELCLKIRRDGPFPEIPGTNGGWGRPVYYTFSVANLTSRPIRDVTTMTDVGARGGLAVCQ